MKNFVTLCCIVLFFLDESTCLRCRLGNQRIDSQFKKALKTCRQRYNNQNSGDEDFMSSNENSSESGSNSEENVYEKSFFYNNRDRSYSQTMNNRRNSEKKSNSNIYLSDGSTNERDFDDTRQNRKNNERNSWNSRNSRSKKNYFNNGDSRYSNNSDHGQTCIIQCFFNELNVVDRKGFPERDLVIPAMSRNIQDPELKDFVEESIIECFRYLDSNKRDKCEFSQNLLKCLAEKGQENCDDWED